MDTEPLNAPATRATEPFDARRIRLAKNQSLFRAVNDQIEYVARAQSTILPIRVLCECADPDCDAHVELTQGEYEGVRQNPTQFLVLPLTSSQSSRRSSRGEATTSSSRSSGRHRHHRSDPRGAIEHCRRSPEDNGVADR